MLWTLITFMELLTIRLSRVRSRVSISSFLIRTLCSLALFHSHHRTNTLLQNPYVFVFHCNHGSEGSVLGFKLRNEFHVVNNPLFFGFSRLPGCLVVLSSPFQVKRIVLFVRIRWSVAPGARRSWRGRHFGNG